MKSKLFAIVALIVALWGMFGCSSYTCPTYAGTHHKYNTRGL